MKKVLKTASVMLVLVMLAAFAVVPGSALATEITAGNTKETATDIPEYGVEYVSSLSTAGEVDWFKFTTLPDDAYYFITLKNYNLPTGGSSYSPNIFLYDTYLQELTSGNNNVTRNLKLEPNTTYYFKVFMGQYEANATGNFSVSVSYRYDVAPNNMENAIYIEGNKEHVFSFDGSNDIDWYKFTPASTGSYEIVFENYNLPTGSSSYSTNIYLYDMYSQELAHRNDTSTFSVELEAGATYYIKTCMGIYATEALGNYELTVNGDVAPDSGTPSEPETTKTLAGITISSTPTKTVYTVGEKISFAGMVVYASYDDGSTVKIANSKCTYGGFNSSKPGTCTVKIYYTEKDVTKTATFTVTVKEAEPETVKVLTGITINSKPTKTVYTVGEKINFAGMVVYASYDDGSTVKIANSKCTYGGFDSSKPGTCTVKIYYTENGVTKVTAFAVTVKEADPITPEVPTTPDVPDTPDTPTVSARLTSIKIATKPTKLVYLIDEPIDTEGMVVVATYSDGTTRTVEDYTVYDYDTSKAGTNIVRIEYSEGGYTKMATYTITVKDAAGTTPDEPSDTGSSFIDRIGEFFANIALVFGKLLEVILGFANSAA